WEYSRIPGSRHRRYRCTRCAGTPGSVCPETSGTSTERTAWRGASLALRHHGIARAWHRRILGAGRHPVVEDEAMVAVPGWFKLVGWAALLWNLLGCLALFADLRLAPGHIARLPEAQQALHAARPGWAVIATAVAVAAGALGSLGLLLRRRWALPLLLASLLGIVVQDVAMFVLVGGARLAGPVAVALQAMVLVIGVALAWLAWWGSRSGWLR